MLVVANLQVKKLWRYQLTSMDRLFRREMKAMATVSAYMHEWHA
jgi:hypothetical protein